jgi:hypothetical protein
MCLGFSSGLGKTASEMHEMLERQCCWEKTDSRFVDSDMGKISVEGGTQSVPPQAAQTKMRRVGPFRFLLISETEIAAMRASFPGRTRNS